jgi:hypothetical protein
MSHQPRCMFALHMDRLVVPYTNDAILRDSRISEYLSSFVTFEDLFRQASESRIDTRLLPTGPPGRRTNEGQRRVYIADNVNR